MRPWGVLLALLLAPLAAAQVPEPPSAGRMSIGLDWAFTPGEPSLPQGSFLDMAVNVTLRFGAAVCSGPGQLVVTVLLAGPEDPGGLATDPTPLTLSFDIPEGPHVGSPSYVAETTATLKLLASPDIPPSLYAVSGEPRVEPPSSCTGVPVGLGVSESPGNVEFPARVTNATFVREAHPEHEEHGPGGLDFFLDPGASRSKQYNVTGEYPYHDHFRPELRGKTIVEETGPMSVTVQVTAQGFNPAEVRIGQGGNVTWTNADRVGHTVSADELHPQHAATVDEHADEDEHGNVTAPAMGGDDNTTAPQAPPRGAPGLEPLALAGALGLAAACWRPRRR